MRAGAGFSAGLGAIALLAGAVRVLPWLLEPSVPFGVALPFARSIVELALEASLLVGFPIGFSLAAYRFAERGDARVYQLLGEAPSRTALRLAPAAAPFVLVLSAVSYAGGRDAEAPGRVAQDLIEHGRSACLASTDGERTHTVPFVGATWLCPPEAEPRLYGRAPLGGAVYSARDLHVAGDMRRVDLDDARVLLGNNEITASTLTLKGLAPFAQSSAVAPWFRAWLVALAAILSAAVSTAYALRGRVRGALGAVALGAAGPLAALGVFRLLDREASSSVTYLVVPLGAFLAAELVGWLVSTRLAQRQSLAP